MPTTREYRISNNFFVSFRRNDLHFRPFKTLTFGTPRNDFIPQRRPFAVVTQSKIITKNENNGKMSASERFERDFGSSPSGPERTNSITVYAKVTTSATRYIAFAPNNRAKIVFFDENSSGARRPHRCYGPLRVVVVVVSAGPDEATRNTSVPLIENHTVAVDRE